MSQQPKRIASGPVTTTSRPYYVPPRVLRDIKSLTPIHGSQGRAIQVATELLLVQKKPIKIQYEINKRRRNGDVVTVRRSYKLLPRTIQLIDKLSMVYGDEGRTLSACVEVLKRQDTLMTARKPAGATRKSVAG